MARFAMCAVRFADIAKGAISAPPWVNLTNRVMLAVGQALEMAVAMDLLVVFKGFQMGKDFGAAGPLLLQFFFNPRRQGVGGRQSRIRWEQKMKLNPERAASAAVAQPMVLETVLPRERVEQLLQVSFDGRVHFVHESANGTPDELSTRPQDVQRN